MRTFTFTTEQLRLLVCSLETARVAAFRDVDALRFATLKVSLMGVAEGSSISLPDEELKDLLTAVDGQIQIAFAESGSGCDEFEELEEDMSALRAIQRCLTQLEEAQVSYG